MSSLAGASGEGPRFGPLAKDLRLCAGKSGRGLSAPEGIFAYLDESPRRVGLISQADASNTMRKKIYSEAEVRLIFLRSEGQPSPVSGQPGHSGAGHNTLSNRELDSRKLASGKNPTAFVHGLRAQVEVATKLLNSTEGQARLGELDAAGPGHRRTITDDVSPAVAIRYGMGQGVGMTRVLPAYALPSTRVRMVVDSTVDSIHIQSIHPLLPGQQ